MKWLSVMRHGFQARGALRNAKAVDAAPPRKRARSVGLPSVVRTWAARAVGVSAGGRCAAPVASRRTRLGDFRGGGSD
jgi:hypothetical protein